MGICFVWQVGGQGFFTAHLVVHGSICIHHKILIAAKIKFFGGLMSFLMRSLANVCEGLSAKNVKSQKVICNFYMFDKGW